MAYEYLWIDKGQRGLIWAAGRCREATLSQEGRRSEFWTFACAAESPLPEFRVVGMGQHLTSLLCVVFTEKPGIKTNVVLKKTDSNRIKTGR